MDYIVYIITRDDNKKYVGTTNAGRIEKRMICHKIDKRFLGHNFTYEIVYKTNDINDCYNTEERLIKEHNTYYDGLNKSINGRGWNYSKKFTTLGYKFSEKSRKKMSVSRIKGIKEGRIIVSRPHTEETKKYLREINTGRQCYSKLNLEQVLEIRSLYERKETLSDVGIIQRNGIKMSYIQAFCKKYAIKYNITPQAMKYIILKKTWPDGIRVWNTGQTKQDTK